MTLTAHYAPSVINDDSPTDAQREALDRFAAAAHAAASARKALTDALTHRDNVALETWPVLRELGSTRIARMVGNDVVNEGTIRKATNHLERQLKEQEAAEAERAAREAEAAQEGTA